MEKAVMISIRPKWCGLIASGEKTVEVRKTWPKLDVPFKCYIYQTKLHLPGRMTLDGKPADPCGVIGEFVCDRTVYLQADIDRDGEKHLYNTVGIGRTCLTDEELFDYLYDGKKNNGFGWHISDLQIYDKPKALNDFLAKPCDFAASCGACTHAIRKDISGFADVPIDCEFSLKRPPQSWCYVEVEK